MNDRDEFGELISNARNLSKTSSFEFLARILYEIKPEKFEEKLLCLDAFRLWIFSVKTPVKIEFQFNIFTIRQIERVNDFHVILETDEKHRHSILGLNDKSSIGPFLVVLIRNLHAVFPHRLSSIVNFQPTSEYENLLRLSKQFAEETNRSSSRILPCGAFSLRYQCAADFHQLQPIRSVENLIENVFSHRISKEFTFREMDSLSQKEFLPILTALRNNDWFKSLTIEDTKLSSEIVDELCQVIRLCKTFDELRLSNCSLKSDFCTKFVQCFINSPIEILDLSNNPIEDKGLNILTGILSQRKFPLRSLNLQYCSITHKGLNGFTSGFISNSNIFKNLKIFNLNGNRIRDENCLTILFSNPENILEELHFSDVEFSLDSFFGILTKLHVKLRRLFVGSAKSSSSTSSPGAVKNFFSKTSTLEILQLFNANLSNEFLRELCDGLHSNAFLTKLDLRLSGNSLESFLRDHAQSFASIPCLNALDISSCEIDNEMSNVIGELTKNHRLKTLHIGKNLNNIKAKNFPRLVQSLKDLISENEIESLSIVDGKLKDNLIEVLLSLCQNTSLQTLDIRGNVLTDVGVRSLARVLKTNRHLKTIFYDRNSLSLTHFEDLIDAFEENFNIEYFPLPVMDIIQMKVSERERLEKLQNLLNKVDSISMRNQSCRETIFPSESLTLIPAANLSKESRLFWEAQQQLIGDQASIDYISSFSSRPNPKSDEIRNVLSRNDRISKIGQKMAEIYLSEEQILIQQWKKFSSQIEEQFFEQNERLSRKFYQIFKDECQIPFDDKFQEQIRSHNKRSNEFVKNFLENQFVSRMNNFSRECFINLSTVLQKRAHEINIEKSNELHKQLENFISSTTTTETSNSSNSSTIDRILNRGNNVIHRLAHRGQTPNQLETTEDVNERSPHVGRVVQAKDQNYLSASVINRTTNLTSPNVANSDRRKTFLTKTSENDTTDDEADRIENDLLELVEKEQQKILSSTRSAPPVLPPKKNFSPVVEETFDLQLETTTKLVHPGRDRPKRNNVQRPARRNLGESPSDFLLEQDETSNIELSTPNIESNFQSQNAENPIKLISKLNKPPPKQQTETGFETTPSLSPEPSADFASTKVSSNKDETSSNFESISPSEPNVAPRTAPRPPIRTRVFPVVEQNRSEPVPVQLRRVQPPEKKIETTTTPEIFSTDDQTNADNSEQYKRMSVKERARMLTTNLTQQVPNEKRTPNPTGSFKTE